MMRLNDLYPGIGTDIVIKRVSINYKDVDVGDLYVCTADATVDRHDFIDAAIENGASAIVVSKDILDKSVPIIKVPDTNRELPYLCQKLYNYPDKKLKMIGVTGTDGKTSVATIIQSLIGSEACGYVGTDGASCAAFKSDNLNVVDDTHLFYEYLEEFVRFNCKYASTEVGSEVLFRGGFQAVEYDVTVFTNITSEHLNIHGSFDNYVNCKLQLFKQTKKDGICILNKDDKFYEQVLSACNGKIFTYGLGSDNALQIVSFKVFPNKTDITFNYRGNEFSFVSPLLGDFNVYNLAAAMLTCLELGFKLEDLLSKVESLYINGRLQLLNTRSPYYVMIDCVHTTNGILRLLNYVSDLDINRSIVVIGQSEESDNLKRQQVGEVVVNNASYAIFTCDDPGNEEPENICNDIVKMFRETKDNFEIVIDRRQAIQKAIDMAKEKDMVLILGRGDKEYQKLKNGRIHFNDVDAAYQAVVNRNIKEEKK